MLESYASRTHRAACVTMDRAACIILCTRIGPADNASNAQGALAADYYMFNACAHTHPYTHHPLVRGAARIVSCEKLPARCVC
jgi:hypothetical protein